MAVKPCEIKKERSSESICRLCFTEREDFRLIFVDEYSSLHAWIGSLTSLKIVKVPGAPASLCLECENILKNFESFREMSFTNDRVFKEIFTQEDSRNDQSDSFTSMTTPDVSEVNFGHSENQETEILDCTIEYPDIQIAVPSTLNSEEDFDDAEEVQKYESRLKRVSEDGEDKKQCTNYKICVKSVKRHIQTHTKIPHICSWCDKTFKGSYELKVHIRSHTNERPFKCDACDKSFTTYSNLVRHERTPTHWS